MKIDKLLIIALIIPLIGLALMNFHAEYALSNGKAYTIPIKGCDPRDILKGHYITYRFKWNYDIDKTVEFLKTSDCISCNSGNCLCLADDNQSAPTFPIRCDDTTNVCISKLKGTFTVVSNKLPQLNKFKNNPENMTSPIFVNEDFEFLTGIEKYYVPENYASQLQELLGNNEGAIKFRVNHQGWAVLIDLFFNGKPWGEFVKK